MESCDSHFWFNRDWDPEYLALIFDVEFDDCTDMWSSDVCDFDLISAVEKAEKYCPIVENISMDDYELCSAAEKIEQEYVLIYLDVEVSFSFFKFRDICY